MRDISKKEKICVQCNNVFRTKDKRRKFCSRSCAATYNNKKYPKREKGYVSPKELKRSIETKKRNELRRAIKKSEREKNFVRKNAKYPYDEYYIYIAIHKTEGRRYASLFHKENREKTFFTSYARYLMSVHKKRILKPTEQVDHINENKLDDRIENLQILTRAQNIIKNLKHRKSTRCMVKLECPNCKKIFIRRYGATHLTKGNIYTSCSRRCSGIISTKLYNKKNIDLSNNVIEIFNVKTFE